MFDAGRRIPGGRAETFRLKLTSGKSARLIARSAPEHDVDVDVDVDGKRAGTWHFARTEGWREATIELPRAAASIELTLTPQAGVGWVNHHVWAAQIP